MALLGFQRSSALSFDLCKDFLNSKTELKKIVRILKAIISTSLLSLWSNCIKLKKTFISKQVLKSKHNQETFLTECHSTADF